MEKQGWTLNKRSKVFLSTLLLLVSSGCASLHEKALRVHEGSSESDVEDILGQPDYFKTGDQPHVEMIAYRGGGDVCVFTFESNALKMKECVRDVNYVPWNKRLGAGLSSMGQSMNNSQPVNCTSTNYGYQTQTHCE